MEIVICAAVVSTTGKIIRGHRHNNCLATLRDMRLGYEYGDGTTQGFITSKNRYVDRKEAMLIQKAAGVPSLDPVGYRGDELYSEDLY